MRITKVFLQYIKAFPFNIYGFFITIFHLILPTKNRTESTSKDVIEFLRFFEQKYGKIRPNFIDCDYLTCVTKAKSSLNYLLIYLHGDDHEDSDWFCENSLCDLDFLKFLSALNPIVWGCNINSEEGFLVSRIIREHSYPFIGVVALDRNNRMSLVVRSETALTAVQLKEFVARAVTRYPIIRRSDCNDGRVSRVVSNGSLTTLSDNNNNNGNIIISDDKNNNSDNIINNRLSVVDREWYRRQISLREMLPLFCDLPRLSPEITESELVSVKLRYPSGAVAETRFLQSDSIKLLFYWVCSSHHCPAGGRFSLFLNTCPKRELFCRPSNLEWDQSSICRRPRRDCQDPPSFLHEGISASTTLYVSDNNCSPDTNTTISGSNHFH